MRPRSEIQDDGMVVQKLILEVLLDIRDLLEKQVKVARKQKRATKAKTTK